MVLGNQVLKHGLFSSDPHPGNVMLLPDGRLGLIDFGQAKELSRQQRAVIARQVIAVATGDEQAMLEIARASKFRTKKNDPKAIIRYTRFTWEGSLRELAKLNKVDPIEQTDGEFVMVRRGTRLGLSGLPFAHSSHRPASLATGAARRDPHAFARRDARRARQHRQRMGAVSP